MFISRAIERFNVGDANKLSKNYVQLSIGSDKNTAVRHDDKTQEFVVQDASQDNQIKFTQVMVGWFTSLKKAFGSREQERTPNVAQAQYVKLRRRGVYTFLYGGRVNVDTFYDYKEV